VTIGCVVAIGLVALVPLEAAGAPAPAAAGRRSVALLGITGGTGLDAKMLASLEEVVLAALSSEGRFARVVGRSDIASVLGWEEKKQKLGCDESSACIAEVAGALGVDVIAATDVARVGAYVLLSFKLIDARSGTALVRVTRKTASESEPVDALEPAVAEAFARAFPVLRLAAAPLAQDERVPAVALPERRASSASPVPKEAVPAAALASTAPAPRSSRAEGEQREPGVEGGRSRLATWCLLGAAAVAAGAGGYFVADAWSSTGAMAGAGDDAAYTKARADAKFATAGANVSFATAGVALATGVAVWWLGGRGSIETSVPEPRR